MKVLSTLLIPTPPTHRGVPGAADAPTDFAAASAASDQVECRDGRPSRHAWAVDVPFMNEKAFDGYDDGLPHDLDILDTITKKKHNRS